MLCLFRADALLIHTVKTNGILIANEEFFFKDPHLNAGICVFEPGTDSQDDGLGISFFLGLV